MKRQLLKGFMLAGLLGTTGLIVGCTERQEAELQEDTQQVGEEVEEFGGEVNEEIREGTGGAGEVFDEDVDIGENEGVIDDGEGPFEQNEPYGEDNVLQEGEAPLEDER